MEPQPLCDLYREFTKPFKSFERAEEAMCHKLAAVSFHHLTEKAKDLVHRAGQNPILYSYGSDGTPMLNRQTFSHPGPDGGKVLRTAGRAVEFNLERAFVKTVSPAGEAETTALFKPPTPLDAGKGAWQVFRASCKFFPRFKSLGHTGVSISHYCFDRALFACLEGNMLQKHA